MPETLTHDDLANAIRFLAIDAVEAAQSGHPGMPMGAADVATILFKDFLKFNPQDPDWPNRDRFILSAGHGSMLLYALLHLTGYADFPLEALQNFRQFGAVTAGHPEYGHGKGIETTTGPLGQGLATAVGIALSEAMTRARIGAETIDHFTYVLAGDGDFMEGVSHEAIQLAGHLKLNKLIVLFDDNEITIDGDTGKAFTGCHLKRFEAAGWEAFRIDGHDPKAIHAAIKRAQKSDVPSMIACRTIIGKGAPHKQNSAAIHGAPLGKDEIALTRENLNWPHPPFEIPSDIRQAWLEIGQKGQETQKAWSQKANLDQLLTFFKNEKLQDALHALDQYKTKILSEPISMATRVASQKVLEIINPICPNMIGGSADLTGSNNTKSKDMPIINKDDYLGQYIHYGVREFAMAAAMNGISLYGGFIPYGGTFLVFSDYARPAIRLAALMRLRVIHVHTHDSIGLGEDGPTHQPIEHLASLRAMPNVNLYRPCDLTETIEAWQAALLRHDGPSILALTRQKLLPQRDRISDDNKTLKGAYILHEASLAHRVTLYASGSEVEIISAARQILEQEGIGTRVVSVPCMEHFNEQSESYQQEILSGEVRIACEAACLQGWERFISHRDAFIGMSGFGASAPASVLYEKFGITKEAVIAKVKSYL